MVVRLFHPWVGGTERQALTLAKSMQAAGVDVTVLTGRWFRGTRRREEVEGVPVIRHQTLWEFFGIRGLRKFGGYLYIVTLAAHILRHRRQYDVLHVHGLNYHTYATVKAAKLAHRPVLVKVANSGPASDVLKMKQGEQLALARYMLPTALAADRFVALNPTIVDELTAAGVPRSSIVHIPNGIDLTSTATMEQTSSTGSSRILFVGRLHPQKNLQTLIQAVAKIHAERPGELSVSLIGEGPARPDLEDLIRGLGLHDVVDMPGEADNVSPHLLDADIFVLPSHAEGMSNALLEAMAHQLPVVVSDIPGNRDVVTDGVDGLTFDPQSADDLASKLLTLVTDPELRQRLGCAARQVVMSTYDLEIVRDRYIEIYDALTT